MRRPEILLPHVGAITAEVLDLEDSLGVEDDAAQRFAVHPDSLDVNGARLAVEHHGLSPRRLRVGHVEDLDLAADDHKASAADEGDTSHIALPAVVEVDHVVLVRCENAYPVLTRVLVGQARASLPGVGNVDRDRTAQLRWSPRELRCRHQTRGRRPNSRLRCRRRTPHQQGPNSDDHRCAAQPAECT